MAVAGNDRLSSSSNQYLSNLLETTPYGYKGFVAENRETGYQLIEPQLEGSGLPPAVAVDRPAFFSLVFRQAAGVLGQATEWRRSA